jgi:hypothetical protein
MITQNNSTKIYQLWINKKDEEDEKKRREKFFILMNQIKIEIESAYI